VRYYLVPMHNVGGCQLGVVLITKYGRGTSHSYLNLPRIRGYLGSGSDGNNHITITPVVVPNGVASVTAHYPASSYPGHVPHQVITQRVRDNIVIFRITGGWDPPSLTSP
jgi:hypothetical protein